MIQNITIEGFKCFGKPQSIPLKRINLLYGKNGRALNACAYSLIQLEKLEL